MKFHLLNTNTKLLKTIDGQRYLLAGLTLAPHSLGGYGSICPESTSGCRSTCVLWFSGRTVTQPVRRAMLRRTTELFTDRATFEARLCSDIERHIRQAQRAKLVPLLRLNVASDLDWTHVIRQFPEAHFYDYTKVRSRLKKDLPSNYHLTYSVSERSDNRFIGRVLRSGRNVAAVFSTRYVPQHGRIDPLPASVSFGHGRQWPVVDGDYFDARLPDIDGRGVVVGLRFKGGLKRRAQAIRSGFCLEVK